jgi:hypothetical protein
MPRLSKKALIPSSSRSLEYITTLFSILIPIIICILMVQLRHFSGPPFQSINNNIWVEGWINACRNTAVLDNPDPGNPATVDQAFNFTGTGIDEKATCSTFVRCILYQATGDYPSYWSSAASILAFIPTIVGLLSNSIEEVVAIADESPALALLLALSSTASFSSRFTNSEVPRIFEQHPDYTLSAQKLIVDLVARSLHGSEKGRARRCLDNKTFHMVGATIALFGCAGGVWYSVWTLARYGCVVWACPVKFHVPLWVALSQSLVALNIALRSYLFRTERLTLRIPENGRVGTLRESRSVASHIGEEIMPIHDIRDQLLDSRVQVRTVVLRCRRHGWKGWVIQTSSSIMSYALYTFATVVLASMILVLPVNAIYTMVIFSIAGGVGRLLGYWAGSSLRIGNVVVVLDVPGAHIKNLKEWLENKDDWQNSDIELTKRQAVR